MQGGTWADLLTTRITFPLVGWSLFSAQRRPRNGLANVRGPFPPFAVQNRAAVAPRVSKIGEPARFFKQPWSQQCRAELSVAHRVKSGHRNFHFSLIISWGDFLQASTLLKVKRYIPVPLLAAANLIAWTFFMGLLLPPHFLAPVFHTHFRNLLKYLEFYTDLDNWRHCVNLIITLDQSFCSLVSKCFEDIFVMFVFNYL